jgi:cytochrome c biogenesis protein CcmG/thiol:disulfide interchange protein DsbE
MGTVVGVLVVSLVLAAAGVTLWGPGQGLSAFGQPDSVPASQPDRRPHPGQMAPDFTLSLLDGSTMALSELRGRVVVVNFWATWCSPCEDELPDLQMVWEKYQEQEVVLVGLAFQEEEAEVRQMASRFGLTYPLGMDMGDRISTAYFITGVPETFVVGPDGRVAYVHIGPVRAEQLMGELDNLLGR